VRNACKDFVENAGGKSSVAIYSKVRGLKCRSVR
jgi:hypothetical protein